MHVKGCEEDEYAESDATESCARLRSSAEEPRKMTSELQAEKTGTCWSVTVS